MNSNASSIGATPDMGVQRRSWHAVNPSWTPPLTPRPGAAPDADYTRAQSTPSAAQLAPLTAALAAAQPHIPTDTSGRIRFTIASFSPR